MLFRCRASSRLMQVAVAPLLLLAVAAHVAPTAAWAQPAEPAAVLYRLFLRDGGTLISYGDFARLPDRVVVSLPIGGSEDAPILHLITIAEGDVDWDRTNAYTQAVRAERYAATRGEADFSALAHRVADLLYQVGRTDEPARRLAIAESARRQLLEWPAAHYGYRSGEVAQMATWLDQTVSELRIAAGQSAFDLAFVAAVDPGLPPLRLLPPPTVRERVELGLAAARRTPEAAERVSLLRALVSLLGPTGSDDQWMADARARASSALGVELKIDAAYSALSRRMLTRSDQLVRRADVRGLQALVAAVLSEDGRLERARPADVGALLATLDARIAAARRLRLARDGWALRSARLFTYWREVRGGLDRLIGVRAWLTDVRQLAGPSPWALERLRGVAALAARDLAAVQPPVEAANAHAMLQTAATLAGRAASDRREAIETGAMEGAWQAASAAAGALMLIDRAIADLQQLTRRPEAD